MALENLILQKGEVIVTISESTLGIKGVDKGIYFGTVQLVNQLSDKTKVGQSVWFEADKAISFVIISGQVFYKIKEDYLSASEIIF